jgi:two-component system osmolarity sensor histidine kinase EnvZ
VAGDTGSVVRLLRGAIHEAYGRDTDVYLHDGEPDQLWVRLPMHGEGDYWVGFPRRRVQQDLNTAFVVWSAVMLVLAFLAVWAIVEVIRRATHEAEHERAMFLAGISHDLRTPLGHLRLDLELAADRLEPEMQREMATDVEDIGTILEQFIDFAGTEADEPLSLVDLSELAAASAERVERAAGSVRLELKPVPQLELRPIAMQRLIVNLLNNAVRHGGGDVTLACGAHGSEVRLSVLDRGPGIAPEALKRVKEPFRRADDGRTGAAGAGLGLAIVDRIARLHGGRLELLARDGGGLEARVTLPAGQR